MTDILDRAVAALRRMPEGDRDGMARAILRLTERTEAPAIEAEHLPFVLEGLAQLERGDFVEGDPADLVAAAFARPVR